MYELKDFETIYSSIPQRKGFRTIIYFGQDREIRYIYIDEKAPKEVIEKWNAQRINEKLNYE